MSDREAPEQREHWQRIDSILDAVLSLPVAEREAGMERECGGDQELLAKVRRLVVADREAGDFLEDVVREGARSALEESTEPSALEGALANARTTPLPGAKLGGRDADGEAEPAETKTLPAGGRPESVAPARPASSRKTAGGAERVPRRIGKYRITETIGRGGFGTVYRATDPQLDRDVAIKVCHSNDAPTRRRFLKEARIAARLQHPSIVTVHDFGAIDAAGELCSENDPNAVPFLVQEFIHGQDLHEIVGEDRPLASKTSLLRQIAQGLWFAHRQGVVHRDVKPSNVRVQQAAGRPDSARILDFGIAGLVDEDDPVEAGTLGYLAPEVLDQMLELQPALEAGTGITATRATLARATSGVAAAADQFAFGVLAFELLVGEHPFPGRSLPDVMTQMNRPDSELEAALTGVPKQLTDLVLRCLARQPERRHQGMGGVVEGLESAEQLERPAAASPSRSRGWRRSGWAALTSILLVVVGVAIAWPFLPGIGIQEVGLRDGESRPEEAEPVADTAEQVSRDHVDDVARTEPGRRRAVGPVRPGGSSARSNGVSSPGSDPSVVPGVRRPAVELGVLSDRSESDLALAGTEFDRTGPVEGVTEADGQGSRPPSAGAPASPLEADGVEIGGESPARARGSSDPSGSRTPRPEDDEPLARVETPVQVADAPDRSLERPASREPKPSDELEPEVLEAVTPNYPPRALRRRLAATVVVAVLVNPQGQVLQTLVKSSERPGMGFERAAEEAARRTRYREWTDQDGAPTWTEITFDFRPPAP